MVKEYELSVHQACEVAEVSRSVYYYQKQDPQDWEVIERLQELADRHPGYGFWKMYMLLRKRGYLWNHKRVYRIYTSLKMNLRRKRKRLLPKREKKPIVVPSALCHTWSIDFMMDRLYEGRPFKIMNILDDYNREALTMELDTSIGSLRVVRALESLKSDGLKPSIIRVDNGTEFTSMNFVNWCTDNEVTIQYIQPGKPVQNAFIERFNGSYRREVLDRYAFTTMQEARDITYEWMAHYNSERPHDSLGSLSPHEYHLQNSSYEHGL